MSKAVVITGASGGIGLALCARFAATGWRVIATDQQSVCSASYAAYVQMDLERICSDAAYREERLRALRLAVAADSLAALINNAALQVVGGVHSLVADDWLATLKVNLMAPFLLVQALLPPLEAASGCVVNVASIHAMLTKPHFSAYASSKAGLVGLTRSLAVELGGRVRVNAVCPAAISTPMLESGFADAPAQRAALAAHHPSGMLGTPEDVAAIVLQLASEGSLFMNGMVVGIDGGIASRLHDPS